MASLLGLASYDSDDSNNPANNESTNTENEAPDYQKTLVDIDPTLSLKSSISIDAAPMVLYSVSCFINQNHHICIKYQVLLFIS